MALAAADLAVGRSGGSVFELAAQGLPSLLVPYPLATGDHQRANARWLEQGGAAVVVDDAELDGEPASRERRRVAWRCAAPGGDGRRGTGARETRRGGAVARLTLEAAR